LQAIIQYLLTGLSVGSVYAMVGLGFCVMWTAAKAVNFDFGQIFMLGGVLAVVLLNLGVPLIAAAIGAVIAAAVASGVIERVFIRPFNREANGTGWMLTTIAVGTMLESATTALFGSEPRGLPTPLMTQPLRIDGAGIYPQELLLPVALVVVGVGLDLFYRKTMVGRAMRAVAFNRTAAGLSALTRIESRCWRLFSPGCLAGWLGC